MLTDTNNAFVPDGQFIIPPTQPGRLDGLTFAAKELFALKGQVTGCGNPDWLAEHPIAQANAPSIDMLLGAGATLKGRTISDEMAFSLDGENDHYGTPLNPKAPDRIPGGSSSGSASAVACGWVDFALGTDTAGSVRIPAAYCGIYGFRPSHGRVNIDHVHPLAPSFDVVGWFARSAQVMRQVAEVLLETQLPQTKVSRLILFKPLFDLVVPEYRQRYIKALQKLTSKGFELVEVEGREFDLPAWTDTLRHIQWWQLNQAHGQWIRAHLNSFGQEIRGRLQLIDTISHREYEYHCEVRQKLIAQLNSVFAVDDILLLPTAPGVAPLKGLSIDCAREFRMKLMQYVCLATIAGLPQLNLPLDDNQDLPLGLSLLGMQGQDERLLSGLSLLR